MNIKGKTNLIVIGVIALVIVGVFIYITADSAQTTVVGGIANGYYHVLSGECRSAEDRPNGVPYFADADEPTEIQCCFNREQQQVDCNDPETLLGPFAIYDGIEGKFWLQSVVRITNNGNVALTGAWVDSATWTPAHASLTSAYASMIGAGVGTPLAEGASIEWSTLLIDLQDIGGSVGNPISYGLTLVTKATAIGLPETSSTHTKSMIVEKEGINFAVDISYVATT